MRNGTENIVRQEGWHSRLPERECKVISSIETECQPRQNQRRSQTKLKRQPKLPLRTASGRFAKAPRGSRDVHVEIANTPNSETQEIDTAAFTDVNRLETKTCSAARHMDWNIVARVEGKRVGCVLHEYLIRWHEISFESSWVAAMDCDCPELIRDFHIRVQDELGIVYIDYAQVPDFCPPLHSEWSQRAYQNGHSRVFDLRRRSSGYPQENNLLNEESPYLARSRPPIARRSVSPPITSAGFSIPGTITCECTTCRRVERLSKPIAIGSTKSIHSNVVNERQHNVPYSDSRMKESSNSQFFHLIDSPSAMRGKTAPPSLMSNKLLVKADTISTQPFQLSPIPTFTSSKARFVMKSEQSKKSRQPSIDKINGEPSNSVFQDNSYEEGVGDRSQTYSTRPSSRPSLPVSNTEAFWPRNTQRAVTPAYSHFSYSPGPTSRSLDSPLTYPNNVPFSSSRISKRTEIPESTTAVLQALGSPENTHHIRYTDYLGDSRDSSSRVINWSTVSPRPDSYASIEEFDNNKMNSTDEMLSLKTPPLSSPMKSSKQSPASPRAPSLEDNPVTAPVILPPNWRKQLLKKGKGHLISNYEAAGARSGTPAPESFGNLPHAHNSVFAGVAAAPRGGKALTDVTKQIGHNLQRRVKKNAVRSSSSCRGHRMDNHIVEHDAQPPENRDARKRTIHSNPLIEVRLDSAPTLAQIMARLGGVFGKNGGFVPLTPTEQRQVLLSQRAHAIQTGFANRTELLEL